MFLSQNLSRPITKENKDRNEAAFLRNGLQGVFLPADSE